MIKSMAKGLTHLAKGLRKRTTDVEQQLLWSRLRAGRFEGMKFRRQHPIGQYITDFVCLEKKLIIELDGGQHALPDQILKDMQRDAWLEKEGYIVVRFWDNEVLTNTNGVLEVIRKRLHRTPSPQGRGSNHPHKMRKNLNVRFTVIPAQAGIQKKTQKRKLLAQRFSMTNFM